MQPPNRRRCLVELCHRAAAGGPPSLIHHHHQGNHAMVHQSLPMRPCLLFCQDSCMLTGPAGGCSPAAHDFARSPATQCSTGVATAADPPPGWQGIEFAIFLIPHRCSHPELPSDGPVCCRFSKPSRGVLSLLSCKCGMASLLAALLRQPNPATHTPTTNTEVSLPKRTFNRSPPTHMQAWQGG